MTSQTEVQEPVLAQHISRISVALAPIRENDQLDHLIQRQGHKNVEFFTYIDLRADVVSCNLLFVLIIK